MLINCYARSLVITWSVLCVYLCYTLINYILFGSTIGRGCAQICCLSGQTYVRQTFILTEIQTPGSASVFTVSDYCRMPLSSAGGAVKKIQRIAKDSAYNPNITSNIFKVNTRWFLPGAETYFKAKWRVTALSNVTAIWSRDTSLHQSASFHRSSRMQCCYPLWVASIFLDSNVLGRYRRQRSWRRRWPPVPP